MGTISRFGSDPQLLLLLVALGASGSACSGDAGVDDEDGETTPTPTPIPEPTGGGAGMGGAGEGMGGAGASEAATGGSAPTVEEPLSVTDPTCGFADGDTGLPAIVIENLGPNETIPHQMVRLVGRLTTDAATVKVVHGEMSATAQVVDKEVVAFAVLEPGLNYVGLEAEGHQPMCFAVNFKEPENQYQVRFHSFTASDSVVDKFHYTDEARGYNEIKCLDGVPCTPRIIADRMRFTALIDQMLVAEVLVAQGAPRETFTLARDEEGLPIDPLFVSERTAEQFLSDALDDGAKDQNSYFVMNEASAEIRARETAEGFDTKYLKNVMIFRDVQSGAWGGGSSASVGGARFYALASNINEFYDLIYDQRDPVVDGGVVALVSAGSTTVSESAISLSGTLLHEFGHTLGLGHRSSVGCNAIMTYGFRHVHRFILPSQDESAICWGRGDPLDPTSVNQEQKVLENPWIAGVDP